MILPIRLDPAAAAQAPGNGTGLPVPEWAMVELQGEIVSQGTLAGQHLGDLFYEQNKPVLVIGSHRLEGMEVLLPKPLLVLQKVTSESDSPDQHQSPEGSSGHDVQRRPAKAVEYKVVGRTTKKIHFKKRPNPIIKASSKDTKPKALLE
eukprot:TRINITY_DN5018_c0_g1_i1.p1 TRINITY_DN5018_c0_g1~~TRINITY_DN5018_c0_g1_i1.p1  ORF type:complete len:149 (+),score=17.72 TRINITY_DN5018_c0_g1_i1:147-593(+)